MLVSSTHTHLHITKKGKLAKRWEITKTLFAWHRRRGGRESNEVTVIEHICQIEKYLIRDQYLGKKWQEGGGGSLIYFEKNCCIFLGSKEQNFNILDFLI